MEALAISPMECQLCDRQVERLTVHHLVPRQHTKRKQQKPSSTIDICSACHRQIHKSFENAYLAKEINTIDKLKAHPKLQKFIVWVRKQDPNKRIRVS